MTKKETDIIESLIVGGVIGAALGSILSKNKTSHTVLGGIAGAAVLASVKAYENAQKTDVPLVVEEDNALYEIHADGTKKLIKKLPAVSLKLPKRFTLK